MKVKLIYSIYGIESKVNEFIKNKNIIDIKYQKENGNESALIMYEEE